MKNRKKLERKEKKRTEVGGGGESGRRRLTRIRTMSSEKKVE